MPGLIVTDAIRRLRRIHPYLIVAVVATPDLGGRGKLENVASGLGVAVLPLSTAQFSIRPDVVHVPVTDRWWRRG